MSITITSQANTKENEMCCYNNNTKNDCLAQISESFRKYLPPLPLHKIVLSYTFLEFSRIKLTTKEMEEVQKTMTVCEMYRSRKLAKDFALQFPTPPTFPTNLSLVERTIVRKITADLFETMFKPEFIDFEYLHGPNGIFSGTFNEAISKLGTYKIMGSILIHAIPRESAEVLIEHVDNTDKINILDNLLTSTFKSLKEENDAIEVLKLIKKFLENENFDLEQRNDRDDTPLISAVRKHAWIEGLEKKEQFEERYKALKYLIDRGANLEVRDRYMCTPLFLAVENGSLDLTEFLIKEGAELDTYGQETNLRAVNNMPLKILDLFGIRHESLYAVAKKSFYRNGEYIYHGQEARVSEVMNKIKMATPWRKRLSNTEILRILSLVIVAVVGYYIFKKF